MTDSDHTPSPTHCISCGTEVPDHAKFCHACGSVVYRPEDKNQLSEPALAEPPVPETSADTDPIGEVLPESAEPESLVPETSTDRVAHDLRQQAAHAVRKKPRSSAPLQSSERRAEPYLDRRSGEQKQRVRQRTRQVLVGIGLIGLLVWFVDSRLSPRSPEEILATDPVELPAQSREQREEPAAELARLREARLGERAGDDWVPPPTGLIGSSTSSTYMVESLARIDAYPRSPSAAAVRRYSRLVATLDIRCTENSSQLSDMAVRATELVKERSGRTVEIRDVLEEMVKATAGLNSIECSEYISVLIMTGGL